MKMFKFLGITAAVTRPGEGLMAGTASLSAKVIRAAERKLTFKEWLREMINWLVRGDRNDYGVICRKMVTTIGVRHLADCMAGATNTITGKTASAVTHKYHCWGTGSTAEAVGNTQASMTYAAPTTYPSTNAVTGTLVSATSSTNATYSSVATITAVSSLAITEHGIFAYVSPGTDDEVVLFDKSNFSAINVISGDSIQFTYTLTLNSGG